MDKPILVIGHRNPDLDSIASALGYAYLKQTQGVNAIAARAGKINLETKYALNYFHLEPPKLVDDLYPRLGDSDLLQLPIVTPDSTIYDVGKIFVEYKPRPKSVPVVDENNEVQGMVTVTNLAKRYFEELTNIEQGNMEMEFSNIMKVLKGKLWCGNINRRFKGTVRIGAATPERMCENLQAGDIIITANREDSQEAALKAGVSGLVLTMGTAPSQRIIELAEKRRALIISTQYTTYNACHLIQQSVQVKYIVPKNFMAFKTSDNITDVQKAMANSESNVFPVLHLGKYIGAVDKTIMLKHQRQKLILVDHNEQSQAVEGIENAEILEIIDHHRLGGLTTGLPIFIRQEPAGSTASIVAKMARHRYVRFTPALAGILLSAIISDTVYFKSPTATQEDRDTAAELAEMAGISDVHGFALDILRQGSALYNLTPEEIVHTDTKEFDFQLGKVMVAQVMTMDSKQSKEKWPGLLKALGDMVANKEANMALLMVTDIMTENTNLLHAGGYEELLTQAFGPQQEDGSYFLKGVLSRKKQVIPLLNENLNK
jgi:manganese-dependent inorganic pyrophosphatase